MRYSNLKILSSLSIALLFTACGKTDELPTEPPRPSTYSKSINSSPSRKPLAIEHRGNTSDTSVSPAGWNGFGLAKFGSSEEELRKTWGQPLQANTPAKGMSCYYLYNDSTPHLRKVKFMLEEGRFVRYDVQDPELVAPGNITVGDSADAIMQVYAGNVHDQPHKYIPGAHTLIVSLPEAESSKLIFETDMNDKVMAWRVGVAPQVYYVEGCG